MIKLHNCLYIAVLLFLGSCGSNNEKTVAEKNNKSSGTSGQKPKIDALQEFLEDLELNALNATSQAILYYNTELKHQSAQNCDSAFVRIKNFAILSAIAINESGKIKEFIDEEGNVSESDLSKLKKLGLLVSYVDNEPYFVSDPSYLKKSFSYCISSSMLQFMEEFELELKELNSKKELLFLNATELKRRIIFWDQFISKNPDFILLEEAHATYGLYFSQYIGGSKEGSSFEEKKDGLFLKDDFRKSYEQFIQESSGSASGKFIKRYYEELKERNFRYDSGIESFLSTSILPFE